MNIKLPVMIFQGSHPERVHAVFAGYYPRCGVLSHGTPRAWHGTLAEVDCRRCLVSLRKVAREQERAIEGRIAGKGGIQRDAFEDRP